MSETFKNESKYNQNSSNSKYNINNIYDSLIGPFSSKEGIKINLSDLKPKHHYKNKDVIFKELYEKEEIIQINLDKEILQNNESKEEEIANYNFHLSFLFYLDLLITDDPIIVNYSYPYKLIDIINQYFLKNNNEFYSKLIKSKIIYDLIQNFRGLEEYNKLKDKDCLEKIEKENIKIFEFNAKQLKLGYTLKDLDKKKIDQIYVDIIESLIKEDNFSNSNCQKIEKILIELGLDKIDITQTMIQSFSKLLTQNKNLNKYKINFIYNFSNVNKINFYFILLKYIFKNSYLIEKIPFLLNTRKSLLNSKKSYINGKSSLKFDDKSKYVLKAFLDDPNDSELILYLDKEECIIPQVNEFDNINNNSNYEIYGTSSEYTVIEYEKTIKGEVIEQLSDGTILCSIENSINIYDQSFNLKSSLTFEDLTYICEINSKLREKDITQFVAYSKQHLTIFNLNILKKKIILKKSIKIKFGCSFFLDINEDLKIISGENGTKFFDGEFKEKKDYEIDKLKDKPYRSGIVIDQNIIALASSKDHNIEGENKLLFFNFNSKKIIYEILGYSFAQYPKSLILFPKDKPRILMCPCEKVSGKKQNGILFINLDILLKTDSEINKIKNDNKEYIFFYNSKNFKINCFCLLFNQQHNIINSSNLKNEYKTYDQYFLAGGDEKDGGRSFGKIYLFKIEFNNTNFNLLIEGNAIDCEIKDDRYHQTIQQSITSMILTNNNEKLLVTSGGNNYIFKKPIINGYLNIENDLNYSTT